MRKYLRYFFRGASKEPLLIIVKVYDNSSGVNIYDIFYIENIVNIYSNSNIVWILP